MKKVLITLFLSSLFITSYAQWIDGGTKITTTQNVGIGTENPGYKLDVVGDARLQNIVLSPDCSLTRNLKDNLTYDNKVLGQYSIGWYSDSWDPGAATLWLSGHAGIKLFTGSKSQFVIHRLGNVGIGTDKPEYKLDVKGDIGVQNIVLSPDCSLTRNLKDNLTYDNKVLGQYSIGWYSDSWDPGAATLWLSGHAGIKLFTGSKPQFVIHRLGNVGIGTDTPTQRLDVSGNIKADGAYINGIVYTNEVKVEATKWADFVFDKDYKLPTLQEVENHINEYKHLPDIPSEKEVKENGVSLGEMQAKLLQKIEELTLYVIDLKKENQEQNNTIQSLKELIQTKTE